MDRPEGKPLAQDVLRDWARAPGYANRAAEFLELARHASLPGVRKRYVKIAEHIGRSRDRSHLVVNGGKAELMPALRFGTDWTQKRH